MSSPPPPIPTSAPLFDFSKTPIASDYTNSWVKVIDNLFTPEECAALIALATSDAEWKQAGVSYALGKERVVTDYRNSHRILRFDDEAAKKIYERLKPHVKEIKRVEPGHEWESVAGPKARGYIWDMVGVNERLSFLRYEPGHFFKPHCDGLPQLPDGRMALATLQIYLGEPDVEGGATRILGSKGKYVDIEPKLGRVLLFQHRNVYHSGEGVTKGVKYTLRSDLMYTVKPAEEEKAYLSDTIHVDPDADVEA
ncbi:hypothetical protein CPC08DRAFT_708884 [Agrocybe pediades]|nr:hypothetical protein CPC08DRAFT_708884 [Agrocybe pediades]